MDGDSKRRAQAQATVMADDESTHSTPLKQTAVIGEQSRDAGGSDAALDKLGDPEDPRTSENADAKLVKGSVVVRDGNDIAQYVVSLQDDHDPALTFRSFIIGSGLTALAACINQIYFYKPVEVSFASVFLCLMAYVIGVAWSKLLPRREHIQKLLPSQAAWLGPVVHFINPGHFGLKEHAVASILSTSSGNGAAIVQVFGAERLFYDRKTEAATAVLTIFSASIFGYGLVGLLRSIIVHRTFLLSKKMAGELLTTAANASHSE
jgi:hypothetical protein